MPIALFPNGEEMNETRLIAIAEMDISARSHKLPKMTPLSDVLWTLIALLVHQPALFLKEFAWNACSILIVKIVLVETLLHQHVTLALKPVCNVCMTVNVQVLASIVVPTINALRIPLQARSSCHLLRWLPWYPFLQCD